jgi:hypothetical protein
LDKSNVTLQSDLDSRNPTDEGFDGLMARINALNKLPWAPSFIMLFCYKTSPIIAKLLSQKGEYDFKLEDLETATSNN